MGIFEQLPSWRRVMQARASRSCRASSPIPAFRAAFRRDVTGEIEGYRLFKGDWDGVKVLLAEKPALEPLIGKSVAEIAAERGADPFDVFFDVALEDDLHMEFSYCLAGDLQRRPSLLDDNYLIGLSDAGAHLTLLADHAYTTYFLGRWIRERGLMPIEQRGAQAHRRAGRAVRHRASAASLKAGCVRRRGAVRSDARHRSRDQARPRPARRRSPPAHQGRRHRGRDRQRRVTVERGELTGARAGQVIRGRADRG